VKEIIENPDNIDQDNSNHQIQHKGQPERTDTINPLTESRCCRPFKHRTGYEHGHNGTESNDKPPSHWLAQRKNLKSANVEVIINRRVDQQNDAEKNQKSDATHNSSKKLKWKR